MRKNLNILIIIVLIATAFLGCSRKKNSFTRRAYHSTTTRYNSYFNAREIKKKNELEIREAHKDDYSEILPLFIYPTESKAKSMYPDMDAIISKCSEAIDRHSMYIKKKEYNRWIADCYLLMGQARFYKQEYFVGEEIFIYIAKAYKQDPLKFEAIIWLARTYMEVDDMVQAESYLDLIDQKGYPKEYNSEYNALFAEFYIKKHNYDDAIKKLTKALETTRKKRDRRRYTYVLAQLWLKKKEFGKASGLFTKVIKLKPEYDMMFQAKINRALSYDTGAEDKDKIKKMLVKMSKDHKNEDYYDQIFYALADIAFKDGDEELGIKYLHQSAASSTSNKKQKALTYLRLGNYHYDKPQYIPAQAYYDSCLTYLPKDYKDFDKIYDRAQALTNLVKNITIINVEDSLQRMATDDDYRKKALANLVQKAKDDEQAAIQASLNQNFTNNNSANNNQQSVGGWYFYNSTTLGFGFTDFKKNWGNIKLEDNWRRKDKQSIAVFEEEDPDSVSTDSIVVNKKTDPDYYIQFIPSGDKEMDISTNKIIEAYYALGNIYREDFEDYKNATKSFETLVARYDTCRYKLPSWYNLYRISLLTDDDVMKEKYKRLILDNYPESEYARIIQDPSYNKVTRENRKRVDNYYSRVYELYSDRYYKKVLIRCEKAKTIFADNHIQDQFDFLAAMSIGHTSPLDSFKVALNKVIIKHPTSKVSEEAKRILALIAKQESAPPTNTSNNTVPYNHVPTDNFIFVAIIPASDKMINSYKIAFSDFNQKYYSSTTFQPIKSISMNNKIQVITIKKFKGDLDALDYYKSVKLNKDNLKTLNEKEYEYFVISEKNFVLFYQDKNVATYLSFFTKNFDLE